MLNCVQLNPSVEGRKKISRGAIFYGPLLFGTIPLSSHIPRVGSYHRISVFFNLNFSPNSAE